MRGFFARWIGVALLALLGALAVAPSQTARANTITNVARADWSSGETRGATFSNSVVLDVGRAASTLTVFGVFAESSLMLQVPQDRCNLTAPANAPSAATAVPVHPISQIRPGEDVILQLIEPAANRDPAAIDSIVLVTQTTAFGRQTITVAETGPNTV